MKKRKLLPVLLALAMVLTMIPASVFADVPEGFSAVPEDRLDTYLVQGVTDDVKDGSIVFTVDSKVDTSDWDQNSGEGSEDSYTYVGLYVTMPEGAESLKMNGEGNADEMTLVTDAFLQNGKYQHWIPVAEKNGNEYSLFWGSREYTILLEWTMDDGSTKKEYVKVTRNLSEDLAVAQLNNGYTYETLEGALAAAGEGDTVTLLQDVDVDKMLVINKTGLILDLNNNKITGSENFVKDTNNNNNHVVDITADGVIVKNGTIAAGTNNNHTLNIWNAEGVNLLDLTLDGSNAGIGGAPLIVGASDVSIGGNMKFITGEKSWYAMNIDSRKVGETSVPANVIVLGNANLTFEGTNPLGIYIENTANVAKDQIGIEFKEGVTFNSEITGFVALATKAGVEATVTDPENAGLAVGEDGNYIIAEVTETPGGTNPDVTDQDKADSPKTSDDFNMAIPFAAAGLALAAMAAVVATRKRHN